MLVALRVPGVDVAELTQTLPPARNPGHAASTHALKEDAHEDDTSLLLVADAEIYRLDAVVRWLDAAEARIRRMPVTEGTGSAPAPRVARRKIGARR